MPVFSTLVTEFPVTDVIKLAGVAQSTSLNENLGKKGLMAFRCLFK
jgi:hypothetical protein